MSLLITWNTLKITFSILNQHFYFQLWTSNCLLRDRLKIVFWSFRTEQRLIRLNSLNIMKHNLKKITKKALANVIQNKLDFIKRHLRRFPKLINNRNLFSWFQSWARPVAQKVKSKVHAVLEIFYVKESISLIGRKNFGPKLKQDAVKLLEITESIYCLYVCLPICKKSTS